MPTSRVDGLPTIESYMEALRLHQRAPSKRDSNRRSYMKRRDVYGSELRANGDVVFWMWRTPIVTWHEDNSFTVVPFSSVTTCRSARQLLPTAVHPMYMSGSVDLAVNGWAYRIPNTATFFRENVTVDADAEDGINSGLYTWRWAPREGTTPIRWATPVRDRRRDAAIRAETGLGQFLAWRTAYVLLGGDVPRASKPYESPYPTPRERGYVSDDAIRAMVRDTTQYRALMMGASVQRIKDLFLPPVGMTVRERPAVPLSSVGSLRRNHQMFYAVMGYSITEADVTQGDVLPARAGAMTTIDIERMP